MYNFTKKKKVASKKKIKKNHATNKNLTKMNILFTIKALLSLLLVFSKIYIYIYNSTFSFTHGVQNIFGLPSLPCLNVQFAQ